MIIFGSFFFFVIMCVFDVEFRLFNLGIGVIQVMKYWFEYEIKINLK